MLWTNKMDQMDQMDKFLETYNLLKWNQKETENVSRKITTNEIEAVIKKLPTNRSPGSDGFAGKFYQTVEELTKLLLNLLQKFQERG